jgi:hypothetical protein
MPHSLPQINPNSLAWTLSLPWVRLSVARSRQGYRPHPSVTRTHSTPSLRLAIASLVRYSPIFMPCFSTHGMPPAADPPPWIPGAGLYVAPVGWTQSRPLPSRYRRRLSISESLHCLTRRYVQFSRRVCQLRGHHHIPILSLDVPGARRSRIVANSDEESPPPVNPPASVASSPYRYVQFSRRVFQLTRCLQQNFILTLSLG